jgi:CHASE2 domain-containing sensor protein
VKDTTTWLRVSYWVGAIADGVVALAMFAETFLARPSPLTHYIPEVPYRYAMGLAGSLMLGWTILLLWADRRPEERRGVLLITNIVILGLMASGVFAVAAGFMSPAVAAPILVFQVSLIALFTSSYVRSVRRNQ